MWLLATLVAPLAAGSLPGGRSAWSPGRASQAHPLLRRLPQKVIQIITEGLPGERLPFRNLGAMESTGMMTFEPEDKGTRVTVNRGARATIPLIGRFLDSFLERGMLKNPKWTMRQVETRHAKEGATAT